ncbi:two-component system chemotaxis response regulator CheY [Rheinheimera pacifica]|uniref:response regulator n=1 Tax=Rheinheimera pacifica TaxID=173990 RepID=UPI000CC29200|nr:response regulator [Rheinheimera pacifica]MDR6983413.1 two-component system chemotaxis response regulator CheY [Rheinheimera pacifica]PKM21014.1 MAG: two-component system response regulator [Gammaproteobacteria bacterium HGW-Gammaproteobacteria-15]
MTQQQCSVLIIDDAYTVREYLRQTLLHLGISNVQEAANGKRGLSAFAEQQHDLVFLDIELPDINGQQLLQLIKTQADKTHVVMVTAHNSVDNVRNSIASGASGFIAKPFSPQKIKNIVERCLSAKLN